MYSVSANYKAAAVGAIQEHQLTGTIGSINFTEANIVSGSFSIQNQCSSGAGSDIQPGSVIVGELSAVFTGINLTRGQWRNKVITPTFALKVGNTWESVPLGVYKVKEAKHTAEGVQVRAYDNMHKFDKSFKKKRFKYSGTMYQFLSDVCTRCHVTLGMTQQQVQALTNGTGSRKIYGLYKDQAANDIKTFRDFLSYIAQATCTFATINRAGQLVLREFGGGTSVDTISDSVRLSGAVFEDYETKYNGIFVNDMDTGDEVYYGYDEDDNSDMLTNLQAEQTDNATATTNLNNEHNAGKISDSDYARQLAALQAESSMLTTRVTAVTLRQSEEQQDPTLGEGSSIILGDNPLLQDANITDRDEDRENILARVMQVAYTPFTCSLVCGAHYDLGDVIEFTNGHAGTSTTCCVMGWEYNLNAENNLEGYGSDPDIINVHSLARKKASVANKDFNETKVEVSNVYNAKNGTEIATISVNGNPKSIYERKANFTGGSSIGDIGSIDDQPENGDLYIQEEEVGEAKYSLEFFGYADPDTNGYTFNKPSDFIKVVNFAWNTATKGYYIRISGMIYDTIKSNETNPQTIANGFQYMPVFKVHLSDTDTHVRYKVICDAEWTYANGTRVPTPGKPSLSEFTQSYRISTGVPTQPVVFENSAEAHYEVSKDYIIDPTKDYYMWFSCWDPYMPSGTPGGRLPLTCTIKNLRIAKVLNKQTGEDDGGVNTEAFPGKMYVRTSDPEESASQTRSLRSAPTRSANDTAENWEEIKFIREAGDGVHLDEKRRLCLDSDVMRAWLKADPPQKSRSFNQYCVRYTGDPDNSVTISFDSAVGWQNKQKVKHDKEGVYTMKCGGTVDTSTVQYVTYKFTGLVAGQPYYFNFKAKFGTDGRSFGNDYTKGLGVVFSTSNSINTNDWTGNPHTFDENTLYASFYRKSGGHYYDFGFTATASTMYMIVTVGDINNGVTTDLTFSYFVISRTERKYARGIYLYDTESDTWLKYRPFGSSGDDGDASISTLAELDDVDIEDLMNGQVLKYNAVTGEWENAAEYSYTLPTASTNTLGGIKVGNNLSIDENGVLSATATSELDAVELTQAEYNQLTPAQKADLDKIYFITDGSGGGGGGGGGDGRTKTLLWGNMPFSYPATQVSDAELSDDIKNYDEIIVYGGWMDSNVEDFREERFEASILDSLPTATTDLSKQFVMVMNPYVQNGAQYSQWIRVSKGNADNIVHFRYNQRVGVYAIVGVKY